jgi:hypothetical protein
MVFASRLRLLLPGKLSQIHESFCFVYVKPSSTVSGITYTGNTVTGCNKYGVIIDQSYPDTLGTPGSGVKISVSTETSVRFEWP